MANPIKDAPFMTGALAALAGGVAGLILAMIGGRPKDDNGQDALLLRAMMFPLIGSTIASGFVVKAAVAEPAQEPIGFLPPPPYFTP